MSKPRRLTDAQYAEMADDYEANPPGADEIAGPIEVAPGTLFIGRPAGRATPTGKTPALPVRLPEPIRSEMKRRVETGTMSSESELVRAALLEYFENHPAST